MDKIIDWGLKFHKWWRGCTQRNGSEVASNVSFGVLLEKHGNLWFGNNGRIKERRRGIEPSSISVQNFSWHSILKVMNDG